MPTDTIYGLLGLATNKETVEKIYKIKNRDLDKPFIILISDIKDLKQFGVQISQKESNLLKQYWPGALSVIFNVKQENLSYLHRGRNSLAFRIPNHKWLIEILKQTGPLVAPSANLQSQQPVVDIIQAREIFKDKIEYFVDAEEIAGQSSTLVKIERNKFQILRQGNVKILSKDLSPIY